MLIWFRSSVGQSNSLLKSRSLVRIQTESPTALVDKWQSHWFQAPGFIGSSPIRGTLSLKNTILDFIVKLNDMDFQLRWLERRSHKPKVTGSIPVWSTTSKRYSLVFNPRLKQWIVVCSISLNDYILGIRIVDLLSPK